MKVWQRVNRGQQQLHYKITLLLFPLTLSILWVLARTRLSLSPWWLCRHTASLLCVFIFEFAILRCGGVHANWSASLEGAYAAVRRERVQRENCIDRILCWNVKAWVLNWIWICCVPAGSALPCHHHVQPCGQIRTHVGQLWQRKPVRQAPKENGRGAALPRRSVLVQKLQISNIKIF